MSDLSEVAAGRDPLSSGALSTGHRLYYDPLDRLVGVDYTNGLTLLYACDGNDNLLRQAYLSRDANSNGVPDAWEHLYGLTNGVLGDTDGDGFSDQQEWLAGTDPRKTNSAPSHLLGPAGTSLATVSFAFTPSSCVLAVGQLGGLVAEEIVIGADGDPGTKTNRLVILSQTASGWTQERVDVGRFGVTSIAIGQPANCPGQEIYLGLRQPGGLGRIAKVEPVGGRWTLNTNWLVQSTSDTASVLGIVDGNDVLVSLAATGVGSGATYSLGFDGKTWFLALVNSSASQRGLATLTTRGRHGVDNHGLRMLDAGLIELQSRRRRESLPPNWIYHPEYGHWYSLTPSAMNWDDAEFYATGEGGAARGHLATVTNSTLSKWLADRFYAGTGLWIGLLYNGECRVRTSGCDYCDGVPADRDWSWSSGAAFSFYTWKTDEPNCWETWCTPYWPFGCTRSAAIKPAAEIADYDGKWNDLDHDRSEVGIIELGLAFPAYVAAEPPVTRRLLWRGHSLNTGDLRLTNAVSILYALVDDLNLNDRVDAEDRFVVAEYLFTGTNAPVLQGVQRMPLSGAGLAGSYGLACVDVLYGNPQVLFTAEPDGRIFSWSATNGTTALQRRLFSARDQGKAWHALAGVRTLEAAQSLVGLRVDPASPTNCDVVLWPPSSELAAPPDYPQTAPLTQILPTPNAGTNLAPVDVRVWDAEGSPARLTLQYQRPLETTGSNATLYPAQYLTTHPTGHTHRVYGNATNDLGVRFTNTVSLRARAQDVTLTGDWSGPVAYQVRTFAASNARATNDYATTFMNQPVDIDVLANDTVSGGVKHIASADPPFYGWAATNANGTVRYTPPGNFVGADWFGYVLTDGAGAFSWAMVTVTVEPQDIVLTPALMASNWFSLQITGPVGMCQVLISTNLATWTDAGAVNNAAGSVSFTEQMPTNAPACFYRAVLAQ